MPFYTPHGLKIRLDLTAIQNVLEDSRVTIDLNDAYADVELWARLPNAMCTVAAIVAAVGTRSAVWTLAAGGAAFAIGNIIQQLAYLPFLRILFPQLLGAWPIALPTTIFAGIFLFWTGDVTAAIALWAVALCNLTGIADILLLPLTPIRIVLRRMRLAPPSGDVEFAFISILNHHASRQHRELNWLIYDQYCDLPA